MRDIELYQQILGLEEPWSVQEVELSTDAGRVDIHVEHAEGHAWFGNFSRVLEPGRSFYVWGGYANLGQLPAGPQGARPLIQPGDRVGQDAPGPHEEGLPWVLRARVLRVEARC